MPPGHASRVFRHPQALVESSSIGDGTRIWAFAHILPGAVIGRDCNLCDHVFVENDVVIGDRVTVKSGVQLWDGVTLEDDVFVGPNATFTNDLFPRSKQYPEGFARTTVREGASIGANATILPGLEIGSRAMVGAGAVVTRSVPPGVIVVGNPARPRGAVRDGPVSSSASPGVAVRQPLTPLEASVYVLPEVADERGLLSFAQVPEHLPFVPRRYFLLYGVPPDATRGAHAHRELHQFIVCTHGACTVDLDDGRARAQIVLDSPRRGVHVPPYTWTTLRPRSTDTSVLVLASEGFDERDYIRDMEQFTELVAARHS